MGKAKGPPTLLAEAILREFPKASSKSLAELLVKRHPLVYNYNSARHCIRHARGANGAGPRHLAIATPSPFSQLLNQIPKAYTLREGSPYHITDCAKLAVIGDLHIPYHSTQAIHACLEYLHKVKPDGILLNGDTIDCHKESTTFQSDPEARDFVEETESTVDFLRLLNKMFPRARKWFKLGNHEERHERYLWAKCPEIFGHPNFRLENILKLEELGIKPIRDKRRVIFGKLSILHGHEYRATIGRPVNPARWLLLKAKSNVMANHFHGEFRDSQRTIAGDDLGAWTNGCLCGLEPPYMPFNEWCWSFSVVDHINDDGQFRVDQKRISSIGKIY
jgi:hypothetical protein